MSKGTVDKGVASNFGGNFALVGASKLTVTGGKIENGQATNGGNIYMEANSGNNPTVDIQNITVSGGTASCGGNLYIKAGTASFTGATITGGTANNPTGYGQGGNLFTEGGTVNLNAGTTMNGGSLVNGNGQNWRPGANGYLNGGTVNIKGTVSSAGGGSQGHNFYVNGKTVVNVDGGKIECTGAEASNVYIRSGTLNIKNNGQVTSTGNNCRNIVTNDEAAQGQVNINLQSGKIIGGKNVTGNGGNINLTSKATMTISGGEITGGSCSDGGGNIANYGTLNITGGKIYGGQAATSNRNNIYSQGDVNISGGEVWGGLTMHNLGKANLTVSGAAVVNGKQNETANPGITYWSYQTNPSKPLTISGKLTGTACIGINMSNWAFANAGDNTADSIKAFFADDTNQGIYLLDSTDSQAGMLYVGQYNCICGGTASKGACAEGGHAKVRWTPWNGTKDNMTSDGHYYLTTDANVGTQITIGSDGRPANVSVNLNGHSLTTTFRIFQLWKNGVLNVADHKGGGKLLTKGNTGDNYGIFQMVESGTTINLYSGYVGMAEGYTNHKDISIAGAGGTFNMYGGTIDGGENGANATSISIGGAGIFNLYGGTVKNGESVSGTDGGNFRVYGKLNIYGGTIENGKSAVQGGNMRVMSGGKVTMTGGTIQNGYATKQGGNVNIADGGFFELKGGKILGGIASESGGNVLVNGDLIVNGGSISGGKNGTADKSSASENSNLFAVNGNVTFKGGTVDGACIINTVNNGCIVKIEDDAVITNANGDGLELAQYGEGVIKPVAEIGVLEEGASIVVNGELNRVFGTGTGAIFDNKGYFSSNDGYTVICTEDGLMMIDATKTHAHCVCGGELAEDETHECVDVIYTAMTTSDHTFYSDDKYASFRGNYYLTDDLNMGGKSINLRHDAQINICLNGHKLTSSTRTVAMFCDGQDGSNCKHSGQTDFVATPVLNIASCEDGGVIASNSTNSENGRVLWARYGDINAYGITIDATKAVNNSGNGHTGIAVQTNTGNATLYNCTVKGGIDNSLSTDFKFGALLSCNGTGNLKLVGDLTLEVSDKAMGLLVLDKCKVDISRLESVNAPISVSASGVFTVGGNDTELKVEDVFTSFISGMDVFTSVNTEPGEAFFGKATCLCDSGTEAHLGECDGSRLELAAWRTSSYLPKTSGNYILLPGHSKTSLCIPADGAMINVNLNGQTVKGSDRIYAPLFVADTGYKCNSATINIVNGTLVSHTSGTQGGVLWMGNGAKVSLYDVTIDARGRNATGSGTVADVGSGAVLNLYGNSTLYGGTTTASGGTLSVAGKVNMWDDTQIIGGTVKKANADSKPVGGCVCISNANAVVTLNDNAVIKDGICEYNAGNIYIATGKLVMNDNAQILNGKAGNISGNVQVSSGQSLVINGGVISGGMTGYKLDTKTGNADTVSANVTALNNANLIMTGGHIAGHVNAFAYSNGASPKITLSGDAKISGGSVNLNMNVDAGSIFAITIGEGGLTEGAEIQINLDTEYVSGTTFVTGVSQADVKYITASQGFLYDNTELIIYVK